jgi:hypothetical protein
METLNFKNLPFCFVILLAVSLLMLSSPLAAQQEYSADYIIPAEDLEVIGDYYETIACDFFQNKDQDLVIRKGDTLIAVQAPMLWNNEPVMLKGTTGIVAMELFPGGALDGRADAVAVVGSQGLGLVTWDWVITDFDLDPVKPTWTNITHLEVGDMDGNGLLDFVCAEPSGDDTNIRILYGTGPGQWDQDTVFVIQEPIKDLEILKWHAGAALQIAAIREAAGLMIYDKGGNEVIPGYAHFSLPEHADGLARLPLSGGLDGLCWFTSTINYLITEIPDHDLVLLRDGETPQITYIGGIKPVAMTAGKFDADGAYDLYISCNYFDTQYCLISKELDAEPGENVFELRQEHPEDVAFFQVGPVQTPMTGNCARVFFGDMDNDGDHDICHPLSSTADDELYLFRNSATDHTAQFLAPYFVEWDSTDDGSDLMTMNLTEGYSPGEATHVELVIYQQPNFDSAVNSVAVEIELFSMDNIVSGNVDFELVCREDDLLSVYNFLFRYITIDTSGRVTRVWPTHQLWVTPIEETLDTFAYENPLLLDPSSIVDYDHYMDAEMTKNLINDPDDTGSSGTGSGVGGGESPPGNGGTSNLP